jgi:hypothetical protein
MNFDRAQKIADAVLYEGYLLYPYRASSRKNQLRFQFGVLAPRAWSEAGGCEHWSMQTECLLRANADAVLAGKIRFLQIQRRTIEVAAVVGGEFEPVESIELNGRLFTSWEEGVEREVAFEFALSDLPAQRNLRFAIEAAHSSEPIRDSAGSIAARIARDTEDLRGVLRLRAQPIGESLFQLTLLVENDTQWTDATASRDQVMSASMVGAHALLAIANGGFVSQTDPPATVREAVNQCSNLHTWPVLIGEDGACDMMLSAPIILGDYPQIAPESPGDLFDATEIDEILTLRTMTLSDAEKHEARATDERAAAIIERVDSIPDELLDRLHGSIRYLREVTNPSAAAPEASRPKVPWWDPGADASVSPETDSIEVAGVAISRGRRVRLRPGARRADAQDMFLEGRVATVQGVFVDVEDRNYLAVTLDDDPASELHQWQGRYFYFAPDEIEPLGDRE